MLWEKSMQLIDANIILRFLLKDNEELTSRAINIFEENDLFCPLEVICEVVFVLQKVYNTSRQDIKNALMTLFNTQNISTNNISVLEYGLQLYSNKNIDFVDALLCSYSYIDGDIIHSFDKKLNSIIKDQEKNI